MIDMNYQDVLSSSDYSVKNINNTGSSLDLLKKELNFCSKILPAVSRTFAISINHLKGNLHIAVATGYLFCRIADTIEDAWDVELKVKHQLFDLFNSLLKEGNSFNNEVAEFEQLTTKLTGDEAHLELCRESHQVFRIFFCLPDPTRIVIIKWVQVMIEGMREFVTLYPNGVKIQTMEEYQTYCFYVAGTVGHLLTGLWKLHGPSQTIKQQHILQNFSAAFGEGLQTVNILKDVANDAKRENNYYIPQELLQRVGSSHAEITLEQKRNANHNVVEEMIYIASVNLEKAFSYYCSLPWRAFRIKLFCILPLLFAFATLKKLATTQDMLVVGRNVKISKSQVKFYLLLAYPMAFHKVFAFFLIKYLRIPQKKGQI